MRRTSSVDRDAALAACGRADYGHGKLEVLPKFNVASLGDIATLYTPVVAYSVQEIIGRPDALHELSTKDNMIAVVTTAQRCWDWVVPARARPCP